MHLGITVNDPTISGFSISVANFVAMLAVLVSVATLVVSAQKDRSLKKKQYADQIRNAAAVLTAKLERWHDLAYGFLEEIQPAITDADVKLVENGDVIAVRDHFWRDLGIVRLSVSQRIRDEQIEIAYASLYGYDPRVRKLFLTAIDRLKGIREATHQKISLLTQDDILRFAGKQITSATLGNRLRTTAAEVATNYSAEMTNVVKPFRHEMIKIIEASDEEIAGKTVPLSDSTEIFPPQ